MRAFLFACLCSTLAMADVAASPTNSIARVWDEQILSAIRIDLPNPPVHARNLFHLSVAMYDAWAAYDPHAVGYLYRGKHTAPDLATARREAISYAAFRILNERYALSRNASTTLAALTAQMVALGYDTNNLAQDPSTPAGVGNTVAATVSSYFLDDGAFQTQAYQDLPPAQGGYVPVNPPLLTQANGTLAIDVNRWQPLAFTNAVSQNNIPVGLIQKFLGAQWLGVRPFALTRDDSTQPWMDPRPPPHLGSASDADFRSNVVASIQRSSELTPDDAVTLDISPGAWGNNTLGTNDGKGHAINPATGQAYPPDVVKRGDFSRVLAEFWADGPNSETPPGHWNVLANSVSDNPAFVKRIGGTGPVVDDLEWDVKVYFALNAAVHDAACAAWSLKRVYDGWRPIEAIRYMGQRGQSTLTEDATYDPKGLPLISNLIEVVTVATAKPGQRHAGLPVGVIALRTWAGNPADPSLQYTGVHWIDASSWLPYQKKTFVTPAFPGYISGHSTFSRAGAEVLAAMTGSEFFPGGLGTFTAQENSFLKTEAGPSQTIQLQWATYYDAADQAGISRLWGGIHVPVDDFTGRIVGAQCGKLVWALARQYFDGSILQAPVTFTIQRTASGQFQLRCPTLRGFLYKLQSTADLSQPFQDEPVAVTQAIDSSLVQSVSAPGSRRFYRMVRLAE